MHPASSNSAAPRHSSPLASIVPGAFSFSFPGIVEAAIRESLPEILFMKRDVTFRALRQHMELDPNGTSAQHVSLVPHKIELMIVTSTFYSPGRTEAELPTPKTAGLLSRIADVAPVPSSVDRCALPLKESPREWRLLDGSMWCYFPVHVQTSPHGAFRTEVPMKEGWCPHGRLVLKFDVEPDPKNPVRHRLLKDIGFFPSSGESWQAKLEYPR